MDEVAVVVDACPLAEPVCRLDGQRMEVKSVCQQTGDVVIGSWVVDVEIEPEERAFGQSLFNPLLAGAGGLAVLYERPLHGQMLSRSGDGHSGDGRLFIGLDRPVRGGLGIRGRVHGGDIGWRRSSLALFPSRRSHSSLSNRWMRSMEDGLCAVLSLSGTALTPREIPR